MTALSKIGPKPFLTFSTVERKVHSTFPFLPGSFRPLSCLGWFDPCPLPPCPVALNTYVHNNDINNCGKIMRLRPLYAPSGQRVRLRCERTQVWISPWTVVFITTALRDAALGSRCALTAMSRSTQPWILPGSLNRVLASAGVRSRMSPLPGGR